MADAESKARASQKSNPYFPRMLVVGQEKQLKKL